MEEDPDELKQEIREMHQTQKEYIDSSTTHQQRRRVENIQVLVALGIIGGLLTLLSQDAINGTSQRVLAILIGFMSSLFILIKTLLPPLIVDGVGPTGMKIDDQIVDSVSKFDRRYSHIAYSVSIISSVILTGMYVIGTRISELLGPMIGELPESSIVQLISDISPAIGALALSWAYYDYYKQASKKREAMSDLKNESRYRKEEFIDRWQHLISENLELTVQPRKIISVGTYSPDLIAENDTGDTVFIEFKKTPILGKHVEALSDKISSYGSRESRNPEMVIVSPEFDEEAVEKIKFSPMIRGVEVPESLEQDDQELKVIG